MEDNSFDFTVVCYNNVLSLLLTFIVYILSPFLCILVDVLRIKTFCRNDVTACVKTGVRQIHVYSKLYDVRVYLYSDKFSNLKEIFCFRT
jgi:hypothetical protein